MIKYDLLMQEKAQVDGSHRRRKIKGIRGMFEF